MPAAGRLRRRHTERRIKLPPKSGELPATWPVNALKQVIAIESAVGGSPAARGSTVAQSCWWAAQTPKMVVTALSHRYD